MKKSERGDWFLTASGKKFYPFDPHESEICIEDIAHALSHVCRFGGHCLKFYSVAQHSVHVCRLLPERFAFHGLMHDATEAYVGDMVRPLKRQIPLYQKFEAKVWRVISLQFGLPLVLSPQVKVADNVALMTERRDLITPIHHEWSVKEKPDIHRIVPLEPCEAKEMFMAEFERLTMV